MLGSQPKDRRLIGQPRPVRSMNGTSACNGRTTARESLTMPRPRKEEQTEKPTFAGFERPESNWFKMPTTWTDITASIDNLAELKVVEYILRHTWGYQEYELKKHITIEEFVRGRKHRDGSRIDRGTGLSERSVYYGLEKATNDGLIEQEVDDSDPGRIKKKYSLKMRNGDIQQTSPQALQSGCLLYTSDAADDLLCVDLGGRRIIK